MDQEAAKRKLMRYSKEVDHRYETPCWEWQRSRDPRGYGLICFDGKQIYTHRLAYRAWIGEIPEGMGVLHKCDNPKCFRPDHLFTGTNFQNVQDRQTKGRTNNPHGENHGLAKLTQAEVDEMRATYDNKQTTIRRFATMHGVSFQTVWNILTGRSWKRRSDEPVLPAVPAESSQGVQNITEGDGNSGEV
jgi:hypothetical protein